MHADGHPPRRARKATETVAKRTQRVRILGACTVSVTTGASTDEVIAAIAGRQRARAARWQLLQAGADPRTIDRRIRSGALIRVHPGVYALPNTEHIPLGPDAAALLACGPGAALSHHSAVILWEFRRGEANPVHIVVPWHRRGPDTRAIEVHRTRILTPADIRIEQGLPVTSPARTLIDAAADRRLADRDIEQMLDEALFFHKRVTRRQLDDRLRRAGNLPGNARLARLLARYAGPTRTDSEPEERLLELIRAARLPEPETQAHVLGYRLDFLWRRQGIAVEVDTYGTHGSPAKFESDRKRDVQLRTQARIEVLRVTDTRIGTEPHAVVADLVRAVDP